MPLELIKGIVTNKQSNVRHEVYDGKDHVVVPMVMIREGVYEGSDGPLLYLEEELSKFPAVWNHKPVVHSHPEISGKGVSACDPKVLADCKLGLIFNTKWNSKKKTLPSESWFDEKGLEKDSRIALTIKNNVPMEVSTGLFAKPEATKGVFGGVRYDGIARHILPDHLAVLPDEKGACGIKDGAGLLMNRLRSMEPKFAAQLKKLDPEQARIVMARMAKLVTNELSFTKIESALQSSLKDKMGIPGVEWYGYVVDVYTDFFIFMSNGKLYRMDYKSSDKGVKLVGDPLEVTRDVRYLDAKGGTVVGNTQNTKKEISMDRKKMVDGLIANGSWEEADRAWLMELEDKKLQRLAPDEKKEKSSPMKELDEILQNHLKEQKKHKDAAEKEKPKKRKTLEECLEEMPEEVSALIVNTLNADVEKKASLITNILAHKNNAFEESYLKTQPVDALIGLKQILDLSTGAGAAKPVLNYAGNGGAPILKSQVGGETKPQKPLERIFPKFAAPASK